MFNRLTYPFLALLFTLVFLPLQLLSQSSFSGYYRFESGILTQKNGEFVFNRNSIQPTFRHQNSDYSLNLSLQLRHHLQSDETFSPEFRLREAYLDLNRKHIDLRIGQQMIVWGRADAAQIHDILTPMDLSEFLTQDFTDLRTGVTALNLTYYFTNNSFQLVGIPVFLPSKLAPPGSRWSIWPTENVDFVDTQIPNARLKNSQFAFRWNNRSSLNWDVDVSFYSGYDPNPVLEKQITTFIPEPRLQISPEYKRNTAIMMGAEFRVNQHLILTTEQVLWTNTRFDDLPVSLRESNQVDLDELNEAQNSRFLANSPSIQSLWGMRFPLAKGNLSLQFIMEYITKHKVTMLQNKAHHTGSILYTRTSTDERWNFRILSRYHLKGNDAWVNPDATYAGFDGLRISAGGHLFYGDQPEPYYGHLTFHNFNSNSFAYLKLTAYW